MCTYSLHQAKIRTGADTHKENKEVQTFLCKVNCFLGMLNFDFKVKKSK